MYTIALFEVITPVDKELEDVAANIGKEPPESEEDGAEADSSEFSFDDGDLTDMDGDFEGGDLGDDTDGQDMTDQNNDPDDANYQELLKTKNIDSNIMNAVKGMDYIRDYDHDLKSPIHPYAVMAMDATDLNDLQRTATNALNMASIQNPSGTYDKKNIAFYADLRDFVNAILKVKKHQATSTDAGDDQ